MHFYGLKNLSSNKILYACNQINQKLCLRINK